MTDPTDTGSPPTGGNGALPDHSHLSRREAIIEALKGRPDGEVVTYEDLSTMTGIDSVPGLQSALSAARYRLAVDHLTAVESVPTVGYRIVPRDERVRLSRNDQGKSIKYLQRGHRNAIYVDVRGLDEQARTALELTARSLAVQMDFNRRMDVRQKSVESALKTTAIPTDRTDAEIKELKERLTRLDQSAAKAPPAKAGPHLPHAQPTKGGQTANAE